MQNTPPSEPVSQENPDEEVSEQKFPGSRRYWIRRYKRGDDSGVGSYGDLATFKAEVLNTLLEERNYRSAIEFGCGDGNQLRLIHYPSYLGFDVSPEALEMCSAHFRADKTKSFKLAGEYSGETADLAVSLDVIFHLVEDQIFHAYMERLFDSALRNVVVYSSNFEGKGDAPHVRHRKFTDWIEKHRPDWALESLIPNRHPYDDQGGGSLAEFHIFKRTAPLNRPRGNISHSPMNNKIATIFGNFVAAAKRRLDLTFDYETCAIRSFKQIAEHLSASEIIDIGANIGVYTVFTSYCPDVQSVHAFEPAIDSFRMLEENVGIQETREKIKTYNMACSSRSGEISFRVVAPLSGINAVVGTEAEEAADDREILTVQAVRLDDQLNLSGKSVCIKIDVEGHETDVIEGAAEILRNNECFVQVESFGGEAEKVQSLMSQMKYIHLFSLQNDHLFIHSSLEQAAAAMLKIIADNLADDLRDLTTLRLEKRRLAAEIKRVWVASGYKHDPLLLRD